MNKKSIVILAIALLLVACLFLGFLGFLGDKIDKYRTDKIVGKWVSSDSVIIFEDSNGRHNVTYSGPLRENDTKERYEGSWEKDGNVYSFYFSNSYIFNPDSIIHTNYWPPIRGTAEIVEGHLIVNIDGSVSSNREYVKA